MESAPIFKWVRPDASCDALDENNSKLYRSFRGRVEEKMAEEEKNIFSLTDFLSMWRECRTGFPHCATKEVGEKLQALILQQPTFLVTLNEDSIALNSFPSPEDVVGWGFRGQVAKVEGDGNLCVVLDGAVKATLKSIPPRLVVVECGVAAYGYVTDTQRSAAGKCKARKNYGPAKVMMCDRAVVIPTFLCVQPIFASL